MIINARVKRRGIVNDKYRNGDPFLQMFWIELCNKVSSSAPSTHGATFFMGKINRQKNVPKKYPCFSVLNYVHYTQKKLFLSFLRLF